MTKLLPRGKKEISLHRIGGASRHRAKRPQSLSGATEGGNRY